MNFRFHQTILLLLVVTHCWAQNVGIGTTAPTASLHIKGSTTDSIVVLDSFEDNALDPPFNLGGIGSQLDGPGNWFISTNAYTGTLGLQVPVSTNENQYEVFTYPVSIPAGRTVTISGRKKHPNLLFAQIAIALGDQVQYLSTSNFLNLWQGFSVSFETTQEESFVYFGFMSTLGGTNGLQLFFDDIQISYDDFTGDASLRIQDGTEAEGKVLVSDDVGSATWKNIDELEVDKLISGDDTLTLYSNGALKWGENTTILSGNSTAWGYNTTANGFSSTAWGENTTAATLYATAWGSYTDASNISSTAWGNSSEASGGYSTAWGTSTEASNYGSTVWGNGSEASGVYSTAWGWSSHAKSNIETAFGRFNESFASGDPNGWQDSDMLFSVGNGEDAQNRNNALTVLKNGNVGLNGVHLPTYRLELPNSAVANEGKARAIAWNTYSDSRIKSEQKILTYGLDEILNLNPKSYQQHTTSVKDQKLLITEEKVPTIGLIAQEVYEIIPEAVNPPEDESIELWSMDYEKLIPVLIKSIQELNAKLEQRDQEQCACCKKKMASLK